VTFTKANGEKRVLRGTRKKEITEGTVKGTGAPENDEIVRVYDIEVNGWRSFRVDSVEKIEVIHE
jgi:hypothetical protein